MPEPAARAYARLEARRNRLLYWVWPAVILGTLPLAALIASSVGYPARQGVAGALLAWAVGGLPLTAVLFGAVAGAGLRGKAEETEAALPVAPRARALGALACAAAALGANVLLISGLIAVAFPDLRDLVLRASALGARDWNSASGAIALYRAASAGLVPLALGWLTAVSFLVALASAHAVLGAVAAIFAALVALLPLAGGLLLQVNCDVRAAFLPAAGACAAALAGGALAAVRRGAPLIARRARTGWREVALLCALPVAGALAAWPAFFHAGRRLLQLEDPARGSSPRGSSEDLRIGIGARLVSVAPSGGKVVLLEGDRPTLAEMMSGKGISRFSETFRDPRGWVWAEVWRASAGGQQTVEIWAGRGDGLLSRYMTVPPGIYFWIDDGWPALTGALPRSLRLDPAKPPVLKLPGG